MRKVSNPAPPLTEDEAQGLWSDLNEAFSPGAPVQERELFAGRIAQLGSLIDTVEQRGRHAIVFGERGVGKTSLVNMVSLILQRPNRPVTAIKVNTDPQDSFDSLWRKVFKRLRYESAPGDEAIRASIADHLPASQLGPDDIQMQLSHFLPSVVPLIIFDEFDRIADSRATMLMADTIKGLSDYSSPATIIMVGVAEDVTELIEGHQSISRALLQIKMPRMSADELAQIITSRYAKCGMKVDDEALWKMTFLARGLPYYAQLLGMYSGRCAVARRVRLVTTEDVEKGLTIAVSELDQSIKESYYCAIRSQRGDDTLFGSVLLACALAKNDELGAFQQAAVSEPLNRIHPGKNYKPTTYAFHMNEFCEPERKRILEKFGEPRNYRYRFTDPMMQPFVIMKGLADQKIDDLTAEIYANKRQLRLFQD